MHTTVHIGYESESVNTNPPPPHGVVVLEKQELKQKEGARLRSSCAQQQCSRVVVEHNVQESSSFVQKYECGLWLWLYLINVKITLMLITEILLVWELSLQKHFGKAIFYCV